jgi:hypothetical protein
MGKRIVKVSPDFKHPKDSDGEFEPGAHFALLYSLPPEQLSCFQVYEDVSEGTPVSPIFPSQQALEHWLLAQGYSEASVRRFVEQGHAPLLIIEPDGTVVDGIDGMSDTKRDYPTT